MLGMAGLGTRSVIQAAYLLIASRWLGAEGYGLFAGSVALVILGAPLASWGSSLLLTRYVARDRGSSRAMWATALVQTGVIGSLLVLCVLVVSSLLLQQRLPLFPMLLLALSELILLPAALAAVSQCYALERGVASAVAVCLVPLGRTLAMLGVLACGLAATPEHAAMAHFIGSALGLAVAIALVAGIDGLPAWHARLRLRDSIRQGTGYAVSNTAGASYQEVDKILMLQILGAAVVGPYTVAFRIASMFLMPVTALISASLPRLLARAGSDDGARTFRALLISGLCYGVLAGVGILVVAPWVPRVFGSEYAHATFYLGLLSPWPALFALRHCLATHLTAHHRQTMRCYVEIAGLGVVVLLNLVFLPRIGGVAAVLALLVSEVLVALVMGLLIRHGYQSESNQAK
ncbi:lipopolysaccharide biosynthesis protein [Luteimonas changyuni]|uniref:lipopolysaccharide biosynthesis protein n=1 Tax=Luteimonas sp. MJ145 TaxID=3129234 RepID=UPI0031BAA7AD